MTAVIHELLQIMAKSPDVWFARHEELARWALAADVDEHSYRSRFLAAKLAPARAGARVIQARSALTVCTDRLTGQQRQQPVDERQLTFENFAPGIGDREPLRPVDFGKRALAAAPGGHSSSNVFDLSAATLNAPSSAQAVTILRPGCTTSPSGSNLPRGRAPVSSSNSRCATVRGSSSPEYSPLGIDQAPRSFFAQNGPPG